MVGGDISFSDIGGYLGNSKKALWLKGSARNWAIKYSSSKCLLV